MLTPSVLPACLNPGRAWPIATGAGFGAGKAYAESAYDFTHPDLLHGRFVQVRVCACVCVCVCVRGLLAYGTLQALPLTFSPVAFLFTGQVSVVADVERNVL